MREQITDDDRAFIESRDMFFLATVDATGRPDCSYKGGDPGFVRVVDEHTLAFPNYDGNGMFRSFGNVLQNPRVGLLLIDFERASRMRVNGVATISQEDPLMGDWANAQFVVRVVVEKVFPNCPRYIHHYQLVERSTFVPRSGCTVPIPDWKRTDWARDVLPEGDPGRAD